MFIYDKMAKKIFEEVSFSIEEALEIILIKTRKVERHIKGYHAYMNELTPEIGEILKTCLEPKNVVDRFAVAVEKEGQITGHLNKGKSGRFAKLYSLSYVRNKEIHVKLKFEGKRSTEAMSKGCKYIVRFSEEEKYTKILKNSLPC